MGKRRGRGGGGRAGVVGPVARWSDTTSAEGSDASFGSLIEGEKSREGRIEEENELPVP